MHSFACFRWLLWSTQCTLKCLNQVRPSSLKSVHYAYDNLYRGANWYISRGIHLHPHAKRRSY